MTDPSYFVFLLFFLIFLTSVDRRLLLFLLFSTARRRQADRTNPLNTFTT
jgi:hypothetical protein